jgi:hypothetical protein
VSGLSSVFMVRGSTQGTGFFNSNYELKILLLAGIVALIAIDWRRRRRADYLHVFLAGTICWTLVEIVLQTSGVRSLRPVAAFGATVPFALQVLLKGSTEGAGVAVFCLFFADRALADAPRRRFAAFAIFTLCMVAMATHAFHDGVHVPNYGGHVPSRRSMLEVGPLLFLTMFSTVGVGWLCRTRHADLRHRGLAMFFCMLVYGVIWTCAEWAAGTRWIEIRTTAGNAHAPPLVECGAFAFDVCIEIAAVYLAFLSIPVMIGTIKPRPRCSSAAAGADP